jgi:hypothetical protein
VYAACVMGLDPGVSEGGFPHSHKKKTRNIFLMSKFHSYLQGELHKRWLKPFLANIVKPYGEDREGEKGHSRLLCFLCAQQSQ